MRTVVFKTLLPVRGNVQQDFEGLLWGPWAWNPWATSGLAQGPRRGRATTPGHCPKGPNPFWTHAEDTPSSAHLE